MTKETQAYLTMKAGTLLRPEKLRIYSDHLVYIRKDYRIGQKYVVSLPLVHIKEVLIQSGLIFKSIQIKSTTNCHFWLKYLSNTEAQKLKRIIGK